MALPTVFAVRRLVVALVFVLAAAAPAAGQAQEVPANTTPPAVLANPVPPSVFTGGPSQVTRTGVTLTGSAFSSGAATTVEFHYGTTTAYGLKTAPVQLAAEAGETQFHVPVTGLTAGTVYHFRLVATNAAGTTLGANRAFTTVAPPRAPWVQTRSATAITPSGATLVARVNPRSQPTTLVFEYGPTTRYGLVSAPVTVPAGDQTVFVQMPVGGIAANARIYYRAVATNATGVGRGNRHVLRTARGISGVTLKLGSRHVVWAQRAFLGGQVSGVNVSKVKVTLWKQDHPFTGAFRPAGTATTTTTGTFGFTTDQLFWSTRFKVTVDTIAGPASSPTVSTLGRLYTKLRISARKRREVELRGLVYPAIDQGKVVIQRRTPKGRWITARTTELSPIATGNRSGFRVRVPRLSSRSARYRAVITPASAGAHTKTYTRSLLAPRRR